MNEDLARRWAPTLNNSPARVETISAELPEDRQAQQQIEDHLYASDNHFWEEVSDAATPTGQQHTGVMIALFPTDEQAEALAVPGGEDPDELHLTLAFLGDVGAEVTRDQEAALISVVAGWAATQTPITVQANGLGIFHNDPPVTYASLDSPALPAMRQSLIEALDKGGLAPLQTHGFIPHMTLAYEALRQHTVPAISMTFDDVVIAFAGVRTTLRFGPEEEEGEGTPEFARLQVSDRPLGPTETPVQAPAQAATFTVEVNGRQLITAPATTIASLREPSVEDITNEHLLWMHGKFVGSEVPNRNGALWSSGDLQLARGTVVNGPLNWLHEARHVIGTLARADYVDPRESYQDSAPDTGLMAPMEPHITATAAIWKWIYPDEAFVVNQASDLGQLWYSMECISSEVACAGPQGCGNSTSYADYLAGAACAHVTQRSSIRQFKNPVFLGGAVIVPPTRPGWAQADASVMTSASAMAEAAFEQAGKPDIRASDWEQMMAQLILFTGSPR